jgi:hypothetical protein
VGEGPGGDRTPVAVCWHCDHLLDAATPLEDNQRPFSDAPSLCIYCGAIGIFDHDLLLRQPRELTLDELFANADFRRQFAQFQAARQYLMLKFKTMHEDEGPDR